jgi:hypothetical protein
MIIGARKVKRCPRCHSNKLHLDHRPRMPQTTEGCQHPVQKVTLLNTCNRCDYSFSSEILMQVFGPPTSQTAITCRSCGSGKAKEEFGVEAAFWQINEKCLAVEFCDFARCRRCLAIHLIRRHETLLAIEALRFSKEKPENMGHSLFPFAHFPEGPFWTEQMQQEEEKKWTLTDIAEEMFFEIDERWFAVGKRLLWYGKPRTYGVMPGITDPFCECGEPPSPESLYPSNEERRDSGQRILLNVKANPLASSKAGEWLVLSLGPVTSRFGAKLIQRLTFIPKELSLYALLAFLVKIEPKKAASSSDGREQTNNLSDKKSNHYTQNYEIPPIGITVEPLWTDIFWDLSGTEKTTTKKIEELAKVHIMSLRKK